MKILRSFSLFAFIVSWVIPAWADVTLPAIFSDHMVLLKTAKVPVWGKADPGEKVTVSLNAVSAEATASSEGKWSLVLDLSQSGPGPFEATVQGKNTIKISDVLVGEVWLASGQSNMAWLMSATTVAPDFYGKSANPLLREFKIAATSSREPLDTMKGQWNVAGPNTTPNFSAVGYYFGRTLQEDLKVPVGIVNASWGGTPSEAWTSKEAIDTIPGIAEKRAQQWKETDTFAATQKSFVGTIGAWLKENNREDTPSDTERYLRGEGEWTTVDLPDGTKKMNLGAGVLWLRREVQIPTAQAGKGLWINFAPKNSYETLYWNGKQIGNLTPSIYPMAKRGYAIPPADVLEGKNTIVIRIYSPTGGPTYIMPPVWSKTDNYGPWQLAIESTFPAFDAAKEAASPKVPQEPLRDSNIASMIYNGMIHPILTYAIRGAIWYQGENNADRAEQYSIAFPLMIEDWRARWGQGPFPFYFCQLSAYMAKNPNPGGSTWAELREAQSEALRLPHTAQAVLFDIGEAGDIHPRNKLDVGKRLALIALSRDYGKALPYSGPVYKAVKIEGNRAVISFDHVEGGLVAKPLPATYPIYSTKNQTAPLVPNSPKSQIEGFSICGEDKKWVWADAKIEGDTVVVWADRVPNPVAVRYAWATNPNGNLYNAADLPASPFRTDTFPGITDDQTY